MPVWFRLGRPNLALSDVRWVDEPAASREADFGSGAEGEWLLHVPSSGMLQARWTLAPHVANEEELTFHLQLPRCPVTRIELQLPRDYELVSDAGVTRRIELEQDPAALQSGPAFVTATDLWQVDLGGRQTCQLQLRRGDAPPPQLALRQTTRYTVSEQGLELVADLQLDCDQRELRHLDLEVAPELQITKVIHEGDSLAWTVSREQPSTNRVTIAFAQPLRGLNRLVRVTAVAPPNVYQDSPLPRVRVVDVQWQQEAVRLKINPPVQLESLSLRDALQVLPSGSEPNGPPALAFQCEGPDYELRVDLAPARAERDFRAATRIEINANELLATIRVDVRSRTPDDFQIRGTLQDNWNLESIETEDPRLIDEWQVVSSPTAPRQLELRFADGLSTTRWTQLTIQARRSIEIGETPLPLSELQPLTLAESDSSVRRFLSWQAAPGIEVSFPNDGRLTWLGLDDLDARETRLVGPQVGERVLLLDPTTLGETAWIRQQADEEARVAARIQIMAQVSSRTTQERYRLEIERLGGQLQQLHVLLSQARTEDLRWFLEEAPQRELPARRQRDPELAGGEVWEIDWPEYAEGTVILVGERSWPTTARDSIALARIGEAATQEGTVLIEGSNELQLSVQAATLFTPLPVEQPRFRKLAPRRYAYRYAPLAEIFTPEPLLSLETRASPDAASSLLVWRMLTETQLDQTGIARNDITLWGENLGTDHLLVRLPAECVVRQVLVNQVEPTYQSTESGQLRIPLPTTERFPCIQLRYDHLGAPLGWWNRIAAHSPQVEATVLDRQWRLWTPPDYGLAPHDPQRLGPVGAQLFGPLARRSGQLPFDFFSAQSWQDVWGVWLASREPLGPKAARILTWLGQRELASVGQWLDQCEGLEAWIDAVQLADLGLTPQTALPDTALPEDLLRGLDRLQRLQLGLVEIGGQVVITSQAALASYPQAVATAESASVIHLHEDRVESGELSGTFNQRARVSFLPARAWQDAMLVWTPAASEVTPYVFNGWQRHSVSDLESQGARIYHRVSHEVLRTISFMLALALTWRLARVSLRRGVIPLAAFLALWLLGPLPLSSLALSSVWGCVCGWFIPLLQPRPGAGGGEASSLATRGSLTTRMAVTLMVCGALSSVARAQTEPGQAAEDPVLEVLVPADLHGEPQSDYVLVPLPLVQRLWTAPGNGSTPSVPWILSQAAYLGALETATAQAPLELNTITADFELQINQPDGMIQFPLAAEAAAALKREAYLDGRPVELQWDPVRSALRVPVRQTGRHHLQLSFHTVTVTDQGRAAVRLPIPSTPQATLSLTSPQDLQSIVVPSSQGAIQRREATGQLRVDLGPTHELRVEWPVTNAVDRSPSIDQLSWLILDRNAVRLEVQLIVDTRRYLEPTLLIEADERLQLDVSMSDQPMSLAPAAEPGVRRMEFDLNAAKDQAVIRLSFVVSGATGIGQVGFPRFHPVGVPVTHWLGVSGGAGLVLRVDPGNGATLSANDYAARWGGAEAPDYAYAFTTEARGWNCQGQESTPLAQVDVQASYALGQATTRAIFLANVRADLAVTFQQQLELPEDFRIETVQILGSGNNRPVRWTRPTPDSASLFFDEPMRGSFQLSVTGRQDDQPLGRRRLPRLSFRDAVQTTSQLDLFRQSDVLLADGLAAAPPEISPFVRNQLGLARWSSRREAPEQDTAWDVEVQPNQRQLEATLTNVISRQQGTWLQQLELALELKHGVLDSLTFEIPTEWTASIQDNPRIRIVYAQAPRSSMARVTIWPLDQPLDPTTPVVFSGPVPVTPGQPLSVPNIRLLDEGRIQRRLYLPSTADGQSLLWNTSGLEPLSDDVAPPKSLVSSGDYRGYQIVGAEFQAIRLPAKTAVGTPRVALSDYVVASQRGDRYTGLALFDLLPDGVDECWVEFPASLRPVAMTVETQPQRIEWVQGTRRTRLRLASNVLPQRIRVQYVGHWPRSSVPAGDATWLAPRLITADRRGRLTSLPVDRTLWTVRPPTEFNVTFLRPTVRWETQQRTRLVHLTAMLDLAARQATDFTLPDMQRWYSAWGERLAAAQASTRIEAAVLANDTPMSLKETLQQQQQRHSEVATQLKLEGLFQQLSGSGNAVDLAGVDACALRRLAESRFWSFPSSATELPMVRQPERTTRSMRITTAVLVALLGLALQRWPASWTWISPRWPCVWGVLFGLAWWIWIEPSFLGWFIVGLSLLVLALLP